MKKSFLILSMMAIAATAVAYDAPTAGTVESPNYYVIKANRGDYRYLAYGQSQQANVRTYLTRTSDITDVNIWAITPGSVEGTVTIKNYTADAYLLNFVDSDETSTVAADATAVTVTNPVNIYLVENNGAYAININSATGASYPSNCISLDAPGGTRDYCGNYIPTSPASGEGSAFWFYKVDMSNGVDAGISGVYKAMEDEANAAALEAAKAAFNQQKEFYLNSFKVYQENVPQVADIIATGIASLEALEYSADYADQISAIWSNTFNQANESIKTVLNGNTYAIKNIRRVTTAPDGAYLTAGEGSYIGSTTYTSANSLFTFTSTSDGGYTIYNAATKTWIGASAAPVTEESQAQAYYPIINSFNNYSGLQLRNSANGSQGLNWQSWENGNVSIWNIADDGSIWSLVDFDTEKAVSDAIAAVSGQFTSYAENLPMIEEIFINAINEMKELTYSDNLDNEINAIKDKVFADANAQLTTGLGGKSFTLKYLRGGDYLNVENGEFTHSADADLTSTVFSFTATTDGGYTIYNNTAKQYISTDLGLTDDTAAAVTVYPALQASGAYYGVALWFNADHSGNGINMNGGDGLHNYDGTDGGSIWGLNEVHGSASINSLPVNNSEVSIIFDLQGRRLSAPVKGINIINGKRVLVK